MIWDREAETASRARDAGAAGRAAAGDGRPGPRARALLSRRARRGRREGRGGDAGPPRRAALHGEGRPAPALPVRALRGAARGGHPHPRLLRHPGQAHRGGLHQKRSPDLAGGHGPGARRRGGRARPAHPDRLRLRPLHRRPGLPRRGRAHGAHRGARLLGQHAPPDAPAPGLPSRTAWPARRPSPSTSARACGSRGATRARSGSPTGSSAPSRGPRRCAAQLEALWGCPAVDFYGLSEIIGPGVAGECVEARDGLHVNEDHFLPEIVDPRSGAPLPAGRGGRAGADLAHQGGAADDPLPHRRRHAARSRRPAAAGGPPCGWRASRGAPTIC